MQAFQSPKLIRLIVLAGLVFSTHVFADSETTQPDSDIEHIRDAFDLTESSSDVLRVKKRVWSDDVPTSIEGIYVRVPYLYKGEICVLETRTKLGRKTQDTIQWYDDADSLDVQYWHPVTPGSCDASEDADVPNAVHVNDPIDIKTVYEIIGFERALIQQAIARPDGAMYGEWMDSRLGEISKPTSLRGQPVEEEIFGAKYFLEGRPEGPSVYFRLIDGRFEVEFVGGWIS